MTLPQADRVIALFDQVCQHLQIDKEWTVRDEHGFIWWPHRLAQRVSVEPPRDYAGQSIIKLHIETDLWKHVRDTEDVRGKLSLLNRFTSLSAFVFDAKTSTVRLHSALYLTDNNIEAVQHVVSHVAILQAAYAQDAATAGAKLNATPNESHHPTSGWRDEPDDMLNVIDRAYGLVGQEPSRFLEIDLQQLGKMDPSPWLLSSGGKTDLVAEFAFLGKEPNPALLTLDGTAHFQINTDACHPQLGNGALVRLMLPVNANPLALNAAEAIEWTAFNQLGAWFLDERGVTFVTFMPSGMFQRGLLENLIWHTAMRVGWASEKVSPSVQH